MTSHSSIRKDIFLLFLLLLIMMSPFIGPLIKGKSINLSSFLYNDSLYYTSRPENYADAVRIPPYIEFATIWMNYPYDIHSARTFREGHLPLWNPFNAAGTPLLGDFQSSPFSPLKVILLIFPTMRAYDFYLLSRLLVAIWGAYILARYLKRSPQASFITSVTYGLSGYIISHFQTLEVTSCCFAPIQFLAAESWARRQNFRSSVLLGAATALMILSGHPEPSALIIVGSFIYGAVRALSLKGERKRIFTNGIVALALGILLTAFMILPFFEFLQYGITYKTYLHYPTPPLIYCIYHLLSVLAPMTTPYSHGPGTYVSLASLCLAIFAIILPGRRWELIVVLLIPLGMAFAIPPLSLVWRIPHFDPSWSGYSMPLFAFCMALLAGQGLDSLTSDPYESRRGQILFYIGISFLVGLFLHSLLISSKTGPGFFHVIPIVISALSGQFLLTLIIMALAAAAWRWMSPVSLKVTIWVLPAIACMDLLMSGWGYTLARPQFDFPETPSIGFLKTHMGYSRIIGLYGSNNIPDTGTVHGLNDLRNHDPIHVRRYRAFMLRADPSIKEILYTTFLTNQPVSPLWDLMGVKFVLQSNAPTTLWNNKYTKDFPKDNPKFFPGRIKAPSLKPVYSDEGLTIYENLRALPRAFIVHKAFFVKGEEESLEALDRIIDGGLDPRKTAIIEVSDEGKREGMEKELGRQADGEAAVIESYRPDLVEISAAMKAPGFVVLTDAFYPGWIAEVDGKRAEILPAYHLVRAIFLNEGQHRVIFRYRPMSFRIGILLSVMTLLGICTALILTRRDKKKIKQ